MTGRQVDVMVFDHFKISDTDSTVLGLTHLLKVELRTDDVQS